MLQGAGGAACHWRGEAWFGRGTAQAQAAYGVSRRLVMNAPARHTHASEYGRPFTNTDGAFCLDGIRARARRVRRE